MRFLGQAIGSVLSQSYQDWELIISDDDSKDGTREFLSTIRDPRVKVHFQQKNLGIFGNLNFLFTLAGNEITQILCQDDYFVDSGALTRLMEQWSMLAAEVAFLRSNTFGGVSKHEAYTVSVLSPLIRPEESDLMFFLFGCIPGNLSNVSVRTEAVKSAGGFRADLPYAGDFEFWSRLGRVRPWALAPIPLSHIRSHPEQGSVTLNRKGELVPQVREVLETLYRKLVVQGYKPTLLRLIATMNYTSRMRDRGVKDLIKGKGSGYLRIVSRELDSSSFSFGRTMGWLIYFLCLGGRMLTVPMAKRLLREHTLRMKQVTANN
jgi:glycosyltransferase involved in cell wall biosynthesis